MERTLISTGTALLFLINASCNLRFRENTERMTALNEIQQTDADFSNRSKEVGMKKAFLEYIEADGVLLQPNSIPVKGADAIDFISFFNDSSVILTWEPMGGDVAASADLGYTYGVYSMQTGDSVRRGTYVTIWKKQADERWKFVLDAGNEGVGAE